MPFDRYQPDQDVRAGQSLLRGIGFEITRSSSTAPLRPFVATRHNSERGTMDMEYKT